MKITSILLILTAFTGCSAKHYAVCMAVGADAGCSHKQFTKQTAAEIGALMASQPGQDERTVWVIDMRKHAKDVQPAPQPTEKPEKNNDDKI